ncbi:BMC domain-containing protein [Thaumasiovibrio sp. DFM-14]|uniref:BMC domain-containing protein n=1 Tax=Thaumasiovibrio sp. DFM-14 TaxID=3384792 RepID=UPI0039A02935
MSSEILNNKMDRVVQEYVVGKEVTLLHLIANPVDQVTASLNFNDRGNAIGIISISPGDAAIIAADIATKSGSVNIIRIDLDAGSLVIGGDSSSVECALNQAGSVLNRLLHFAVCQVTRT